jgi:hypothetical protein
MQERFDDQASDSVPRGTARDTRPSEDIKCIGVDGIDEAPILRAMSFDQCARLNRCRARLDFDDEWDARETFEDLVERRDATGTAYRRRRLHTSKTARRVQRSELRQRHAIHSTASVSGAVNGGVVNHDYLAIRREMDVELDCIGALGDSEPHRFEGVLRPARPPAAMRYDRPGVRIKQDVHTASPFAAGIGES